MWSNKQKRFGKMKTDKMEPNRIAFGVHKMTRTNKKALKNRSWMMTMSMMEQLNTNFDGFDSQIDRTIVG